MYVLSSVDLIADTALTVIQIYRQMANEKGTTVYALQKKFQSVFGFTLPLFHGRGLLNCTCHQLNLANYNNNVPSPDNLGLMPYRRRIVAVSTYTFNFRR